jgi:hypothetical protein
MKRNPEDQMEYDLFEQEYAEEITSHAEYLIEVGDYTEDEYDEAYEQAIEEIAQENNIELI